MSTALLELAHIQKSFGGARALTDANLNLHSGQVTALIGENGAGKSTLVKILSGVHQADAGDIYLDGQRIQITHPEHARQLGISVVHQESMVFDHLSVAENIFINARPLRNKLISWRAMREQAASILRDLDAGFDPNINAGQLSIAQKHVVQIARALSSAARVLILDEPTASLSQRETSDLFRITRKLRDSGCAVLFISHKFDEIFEIADCFSVFRDGATVGAGTIAQTNRDELIRMMVGRSMDQLFPKAVSTFGAELLNVQQLSRSGEFSDVSFNVRRGEILGVYGLVGAGRTELAQVLFGLNNADSGFIQMNGQTISLRSPEDAVNAGIALVPEDRQTQGSIQSFSIAANTALPNLAKLAPNGWSNTERESQLATDWINQLEIKTQGSQQAMHDLSGGNQQKVVIAKWLARKPSLLILDEPTKGIDVGAKAAVHAVTSDFAQQGSAVVMISSDLPEILGMSDRILVMRRGRVSAMFDRSDANSENILRAASDA